MLFRSHGWVFEQAICLVDFTFALSGDGLDCPEWYGCLQEALAEPDVDGAWGSPVGRLSVPCVGSWQGFEGLSSFCFVADADLPTRSWGCGGRRGWFQARGCWRSYRAGCGACAGIWFRAMRRRTPDGFKRSGSFSCAALLGGGYGEPVLEVFEGHDCKYA